MEYQLVYADPPWRYDFSKSNNREIENHYPTMSNDEICALKIPTAADAILYLWATAPKLLEALEVMKSWGFKYVTHAVWDKEIMGMGYWFRGQHEILMVGTKGNVSPPPQGLRTSSVLRYARTKHSRKPYEIRRLLSRWYPNLTKVELFCREPAPGWYAWGNEVNSIEDIEGGDAGRVNTLF